MRLASKMGWAGIALTLLTGGLSLQALPRSAESNSGEETAAPFVVKNEIRKMQEILRDKGHYRGKIDGAFGLRTRASIRAYQKAEKLPITGQVDGRTADGLGLRPELAWGNSKGAEQDVRRGSDRASGKTKPDKPSPGRNWARGSGRSSKARRSAIKTVAAPESGRGESKKTLQAENENHPQ